jgi:hypothetical protein
VKDVKNMVLVLCISTFRSRKGDQEIRTLKQSCVTLLTVSGNTVIILRAYRYGGQRNLPRNSRSARCEGEGVGGGALIKKRCIGEVRIEKVYGEGVTSPKLLLR